MRKWAYFVLGVLGVACAKSTDGFGGGGGASIRALCTASCACTEGGDCPSADVDDCVTTAEAEQADAKDADCGSEYDDVIKCQKDNAECLDGDFVVSGCSDEQASFLSCMGGGSTTTTTSITSTGSDTTTSTSSGGDCPYQNDGVCDEPQGTGLCPPGSDFVDCQSSSTTTSTSSGSSGCDNTGTCGDSASGCIACALNDTCFFALDDCNNSQSCIDFATCIGDCVDDACFNACASSYPSGADIYNTLVSCVYCDACYNDCDGASIGCP